MQIDSPIEIAPEHWMRWKQDPVTREVFRVLQIELEVWADALLEGRSLDSTNIAAATAKMVGAVQGLKVVLFDLELVLQEQWEEQKREKEEEVYGKPIGSTAG
jgi:hypothetical protein